MTAPRARKTARSCPTGHLCRWRAAIGRSTLQSDERRAERGPIWSDSGAPGGTRYVPFGGVRAGSGRSSPPRPPTADELRALLAPMLEPILARLNDLDAKTAALHAVFSALTQQVGTINQQIADLSAKTSPPLPDYIGRVGPITVISRPRT